MCKSPTFDCWIKIIALMMLVFFATLGISIVAFAISNAGTNAEPLSVTLLPDGVTSRIVLSTDLVNGYVTTLNIQTGMTTRAVDIHLNNIHTECKFLEHTEICDVKTTLTAKADCQLVGRTMVDKSTTCEDDKLCANYEILEAPVCGWPVIITKNMWVAVQYTKGACYDVAEIIPNDCTIVGDIEITEVSLDNTTSFSIDITNERITEHSHSVYISNVQKRLPFSEKQVFLRNTKEVGTQFKTINDYELCLHNTFGRCLGPLEIDSNKVTRVLLAPTKRVDWGRTVLYAKEEFGKTHIFVYDEDIRSTLDERGNTLTDVVGAFTKVKDDKFIRFRQAEKNSIEFALDILGIYSSETVKVCPLIDAAIECVGTSRQDYMSCELKLIIGHTEGPAITLEWEDELLSIECITSTIPLPSIPMIEDEIEFSLFSENMETFTSKTTPDIKIPTGEDDSDGGAGTGGNPFTSDDRNKFNKFWTTFWILGIVISGVMLAMLIGWTFIVAFIYKRWCWGYGYMRTEKEMSSY